MKRKLLTVLMCVTMTAALFAGCENSDSGGTADTPQEDSGDGAQTAEDDAQTAAAEDVADDAAGVINMADANIAVFYYTYADTYIASVRSAMDAEFMAMGMSEGKGYQNYDANSNQTTQNEQIDTAISTGADLLIVNIVTSGSVDASTAIVDKAKAADIPVLFFNRAIEGDEEEGTVLGSYDKRAFVGTDAPEAGHMQGEMIGQYVLDNYDAVDLNGDGKISYALFMGQLGNVEAIYRSQYAVEDANTALTAAGKPELEYFDSSNSDCYQVDQEGNWSATASNNYMTTNLSQYNESNDNMIELIICNNDGMAEGAITALNDKGYNLGTKDSIMIPVFGVDATDAAKELIATGQMTGTIKQDAEGMASCITYMASNAVSGNDLMADTGAYHISENVPNKIYIPYGKYTGE